PHPPAPQTPPAPPSSPIEVATLLALLRQAAARRSPVWVGYVDGDGVAAQRLVEPLQVDGGRVSAFDRQTASVRTFPVSRVTAVVPVSAGAGTEPPPR
ncbi:MAG: WYL domain-containing protein, partial [Kineosporiaceae bacterium]